MPHGSQISKRLCIARVNQIKLDHDYSLKVCLEMANKIQTSQFQTGRLRKIIPQAVLRPLESGACALYMVKEESGTESHTCKAECVAAPPKLSTGRPGQLAARRKNHRCVWRAYYRASILTV